LGTGAVGVGAGCVVVGAGAVAVGTDTVVGAAVGAWIAGSDFSPQPATASPTTAADAAISGRGPALNLPRFALTTRAR
jgi:hypothetical protein